MQKANRATQATRIIRLPFQPLNTPVISSSSSSSNHTTKHQHKILSTVNTTYKLGWYSICWNEIRHGTWLQWLFASPQSAHAQSVSPCSTPQTQCISQYSVLSSMSQLTTSQTQYRYYCRTQGAKAAIANPVPRRQSAKKSTPETTEMEKNLRSFEVRSSDKSFSALGGFTHWPPHTRLSASGPRNPVFAPCSPCRP